jgi:hypothetical protein
MQNRLHVDGCFFIEQCKLHRNLFEYHVVLCQSSCLVRKQELYSSQLLRNGRVPGNTVWDFIIVLDAISVPDLSEVEVDSHRDRDNGTKQENQPEVLKVPLADKSVSYNYC